MMRFCSSPALNSIKPSGLSKPFYSESTPVGATSYIGPAKRINAKKNGREGCSGPELPTGKTAKHHLKAVYETLKQKKHRIYTVLFLFVLIPG